MAHDMSTAWLCVAVLIVLMKGSSACSHYMFDLDRPGRTIKRLDASQYMYITKAR